MDWENQHLNVFEFPQRIWAARNKFSSLTCCDKTNIGRGPEFF